MKHIAENLRHIASGNNLINGKKFSLMYSKLRWAVEYMKDGSDIPSTRAFGTNPDTIIFHLTTCNKELSKLPGHYTINLESIRQRAHLSVDDDGETVKKKIIAAYESYITDPDLADKKEFQAIVPSLRAKLKWKQMA